MVVGQRGALALFILRALLVVGAGAAVAFALLARRDAGSTPSARYVCPMHPGISGSAPAECPVCGMKLVASGPAPADGEDRASTRERRPGPDELGVASRILVPHEISAPAWVEGPGTIAAQLYRDDLAVLAPQETGLFRVTPAGPGVAERSVAVRFAVGKPTAWDAATVVVRLAVSPALALSPGQVGRIELGRRNAPALVVPASAVLESPPRVLVVGPDGRLTSRAVEVGRSVSGFAVVVSGLRERETVVIGNPVGFDVDRRRDAPDPGKP